MAALVDGQAAVCVAIVGKADVQAVLNNKALQALDVGGAAGDVDVVAVGGVVDHVGLRTQGVEDRTSDARGRTVGAVQADLHALQREAAAGD